MTWLDKLEHKFGNLAIHGLIRIVVAFNALVFLIAQVNPYYLNVLMLSPQRVMQGEVWRLVTYIFIPQTQSFLWIIFYLGFTWFLGDGLEHAWGAFKLNVFYFLGMLGCTVAAFFFPTGSTGTILNTTLLFAFATIYPDQIIQLFLILPVKIKWVALLALGFLVVNAAAGSVSVKLATLASVINYLVFFGPTLARNMRDRAQVAARRRKFEIAAVPQDSALHRCAVCGRTEITDPDLDFRVARDGEEYCTAHLPSATAPAPKS